MALNIAPEEFIRFTRPFDKVKEARLSLTNPNEGDTIYKIKTTAPKLYFVRPNSGVIKPGSTVEVLVGLQPRNDVQDDFKCKDKFLIQSFQIDENQSTADLAALWTSIEHEKKDQIKEKKLRVSYEPESANDESVSTSALKKTTEPANTTRAQPVLAEKSTPPSKPSEPITPPPTTPLTDVPLSALEAKESNNIEKKSEILDQIAQEQPKKAENKLDLAGQLKEKDQKIAELTKLLNENGLLGGHLDSSDKTPLNNLGLLNTKEVDGISLPTAIFLAFVAFFIGWLFF